MRRYLPHLLAGLLFVIMAVLWLKNWGDEAAANQAGQTVTAAPAKEVARTPRVNVPVKAPVKVYAGGAALKGGIQLPQHVVEDEHVEVLASSKIDGRDEHPKTVTTVLNVETGESETYVRTDPLPWFVMSSRGGVGMYGGLKNGEPAVRLEARQEVFRVKALSFGGVASIDQPLNGSSSPDWFVGVGAEWHW
jgi:hypothetical protein